MTDKYITKDSGARRTFDSGAVRDVPTGKGRYDLISPFAMARLAGVLERGAAKYDDRNWERGIKLSSFVDSAKRHIEQFMMGMTDEDHLGQALWNIHSLIHTQEMIARGVLPAELDDLPRYEPPEDLCAPEKAIDVRLDSKTSEPTPGLDDNRVCYKGGCDNPVGSRPGSRTAWRWFMSVINTWEIPQLADYGGWTCQEKKRRTRQIVSLWVITKTDAIGRTATIQGP